MNFMTFHILGVVTPTDFHIFQRGRSTSNQMNMGSFQQTWHDQWICRFLKWMIYLSFTAHLRGKVIVMCNSHCRDVPGIFGERVGFCRFWYKTGLAGLWGPNQWQFGFVQPLHRVFRTCLQKGTSCMNFGIELVDSQNYEVSFFQTWSKTYFGIYEMWLKTYFGIYGVICCWIKFFTERSPMSFKFVLGVGTWYFCTCHFVLC